MHADAVGVDGDVVGCCGAGAVTTGFGVTGPTTGGAGRTVTVCDEPRPLALITVLIAGLTCVWCVRLIVSYPVVVGSASLGSLATVYVNATTHADPVPGSVTRAPPSGVNT